MVAVWHEDAPNSNADGIPFALAGGTWSAAANVSNSEDSPDYPALAVENNGTVHIVWSEWLASYQIYYAQSE